VIVSLSSVMLFFRIRVLLRDFERNLTWGTKIDTGPLASGSLVEIL